MIRRILIELAWLTCLGVVLLLMLWGATSTVGCQRKAETWARAMERAEQERESRNR